MVLISCCLSVGTMEKECPTVERSSIGKMVRGGKIDHI